MLRVTVHAQPRDVELLHEDFRSLQRWSDALLLLAGVFAAGMCVVVDIRMKEKKDRLRTSKQNIKKKNINVKYDVLLQFFPTQSPLDPS